MTLLIPYIVEGLPRRLGPGVLCVGEVLNAQVQDGPHPAQRVPCAAAMAQIVLLDAAADLVNGVPGDYEEPPMVEHRATDVVTPSGSW